MSEQEKQHLSVYFNSACPVCKAGINAQKNKSVACTIDWKDIHHDNDLVSEIEKDISSVRKYLHVTDLDGKQHIGIDAFILLWKASPTEQRKAAFFSLPVVRNLSQIGYFVFANALYLWNKLRKNW